MKIAKYNGKFYVYVPKAGNIITKYKDKTNHSFIYVSENNIYFKHVLESDLSDIFEIKYRLKYDTMLPNVSDMWEIGNTSQDIKDNKILIRFSNGILPNWQVEENNVCIKYIDKDKVQFGEIIRFYQKKDNIVLPNIKKIVETVNIDELIDTHKKYQRENL